MKTDLPVLILKEIILLPNNEMQIEFNNDNSKNIIDLSELFHDNKIFIASLNNKDEVLDTKKLPKIGVIAKFQNKIILPNGKIRINLKVLSRAKVHEYLNHSPEILEAIVSISKEQLCNNKLIYDKANKEIKKYFKMVPVLGNMILPRIKNETDLSIITDITAQSLNLPYERNNLYLNTLNIEKRTEMLLEDIYKQQQVFNMERKIDDKVKKEIDKSQREFILKEKIRIIKEELGENTNQDSPISKLEDRISKLKCQNKVKQKLREELDTYKELPRTSPEVGILGNHIEYLLDLPWSTKTKDNIDLNKAKEILDKNHYGIEKAKTRIIEYLAVKKMTKKISGRVICLVGPPGVGKTTLVSSIANAMNRKFVKISLGGVDDTSEIIGHRKTYVGAKPGRIITSIKKAKTSNPVFLIDEIDKLSKSINGDPASALLEVLDIEQNKYFVDNYVEEEFDLSNVLFVLTANYIENIPYALKDRLEIIELSGYTELEKLEIAKKHLIPKLCKENGLKKIKLTDKQILFIIRNYTKEAGVRDLKRKIDKIIRKIVTKQILENVTIDRITNIEELLGPTIINTNISGNKIGIANGLAYTSFGGELLPIEVTTYKGNGELILTGSLGDVMKESAYIALSYIKTNHEFLKIDYQKLMESDIHIHIPEGAIPKDGPSAGITLTSAMISCLTNKPLNNQIAMTGEITLHGDVLPIGGLKEKSIGALRNNIKKIIIPYENYKETKYLPNEIKDNIEYIKVKNYKEVLKYILMEK